ncbi:MAG: regulatory iron-sulfur-containing complex subunit RicT [Candidatus Margulisbacteria bacterium]|nr:regulatory iron-sulfur-containing complex subunit RicT [Candidatus Margulisiibacteriota bacterium]
MSEGTIYFGVKFRYFDKVYSIQKLSIPVKLNDPVVVETNRGNEFGVIALIKEIPHSKKPKLDIMVKRVVRIATDEDIQAFNKIEEQEKEAFIECVRRNLQYQYPVKFFKVEKLFDGSRYIIYYKKGEEDQYKKQSKRKVSFQPLISELGAFLNAKVELREVGNRGEAKIFGGLGSCGKSLCCVNWNKKGSAVTVKMAKEQGLAINIPKLSGACGRLICCLCYERENYQDGNFCHE